MTTNETTDNLTEYEYFLYHEWFKSEEIRKEIVSARPNDGWLDNSLRLFFEVRFWDGDVEDLPESNWEEKVNWEIMAEMIEKDLTFLRMAV